MNEFCDYCGTDLGESGYLRAVGWSDWEGIQRPLIKTWCGRCDTPDDIDLSASAELLKMAGRA